MKTLRIPTWFVLFAVLAGCNALSLERHTTNQAMTAADIRYQLVINILARSAANPGNLPAIGTVTDGSVSVSDKATIDIKTALDGIKGFTSETISGGASRSPSLAWTLDTASTADQVRAAQTACMWALTGCPPQDSQSIDLLKKFQVYEDLVCLNANYQGWFCTGCKSNVPRNCLYVSQQGDRSFWVPQGGLQALSEFTLILSDIATVSTSSLNGSATVSIVDTKNTPVTQRTVAFIYDPQVPNRIDFVTPLVVYGPSDATHVDAKWAVACRGRDHTYGATANELTNVETLNSRPLPPSGANPSREYQLQQEQQQTQTQMFLSH